MEILDVKKFFKENKLTLGSVESFTGGLFASKITSLSGAASYFKGGLVTYYTEEKHRLLGISNSIIKKYGVVSKQVAYLMALKGAKKLKCDVCVSFTGNAGPIGMEGKPVGEVYVGVYKHGKTEVFPLTLKGERDEIRERAIEFAISQILKK